MCLPSHVPPICLMLHSATAFASPSADLPAACARGVYPSFKLHSLAGDFLMAARKRKKSMTANYLISTDADHMTKESLSVIGKVRAMDQVSLRPAPSCSLLTAPSCPLRQTTTHLHHSPDAPLCLPMVPYGPPCASPCSPWPFPSCPVPCPLHALDQVPLSPGMIFTIYDGGENPKTLLKHAEQVTCFPKFAQ